MCSTGLFVIDVDLDQRANESVTYSAEADADVSHAAEMSDTESSVNDSESVKHTN